MDARRSEMNGDAIDRELQDLLTVEPSADFRARVHARIEQQSQSAGWLSWPRAAIAFGTFIVVVAAAFVAMHEQQAPPSIAVATPVTARPEVAPRVVNDTPPPLGEGAPRTVRRAPHRYEQHEPPIVFAADEIRGMELLIDMSRRRDAQLAQLLSNTETSNAAPPDLVVPPLSVELISETY